MLRTDRDRYSRMRLNGFLDVDRIHECRCLVVGAGALGNETVKDLAMSGFRDITLVDDDRVSRSNLSRCLFFRDRDAGRARKTKAVASRVRDLDPDCRVKAVVSRIQDVEDYDYDVILGCLDNISTRLHLNAHAYHCGVPYIDGATHGFRGKVQVVLPDGPCLQCAMNRTHADEIERHFSCSGEELYTSPIPSDISTTAVIAGMQVREAMKVASGRADMYIRNVCYYDGETGSCEVLTVGEDKACPNHMR